MRLHDAVIGLGSSLGDRRAALRLAVAAIDAMPGTRVVAASRIYRTRPVGAAAGHFYNAAVRVQTTRSARGLVRAFQAIERRVGRRPSVRWGDRVLDLDLLLYDDRIRPAGGCTLPHPGLLSRRFALLPAREVAPDAIHPVSGRPLGQLGMPDGPVARPVGLLPQPARRLAPRGGLQYRPRPKLPDPRSPVKIFLDTANLDEIREAYSWGILDGVTTNPSLIAREGRDFIDAIAEICDIVQGPVSAETVSPDTEGMVREGRLLALVSEHVVVKIPLTRAGLAATRTLSDEGIDCNVTLCFSANQALLAAKAGAAYISPFVGRLDDVGQDGVELIEQIVSIYDNYPALGTEVLAASVRHPAHMTQVALAGAHVATIPYKVLNQLVAHPLTDRGLASFLKDWETVPDNDITARVTRWLAEKGR